MRDTVQGITERLGSAPDYWTEARRAADPFESLDGMLPASRALPDCSLALDLVYHCGVRNGTAVLGDYDGLWILEVGDRFRDHWRECLSVLQAYLGAERPPPMNSIAAPVVWKRISDPWILTRSASLLPGHPEGRSVWAALLIVPKPRT